MSISQQDYDAKVAEVMCLRKELEDAKTYDIELEEVGAPVGGRTPGFRQRKKKRRSEIDQLNKNLGLLYERLDGKMLLVNAFANVSREDRNLIVYKNLREREQKDALEEKKKEQSFYEMRAFNNSVKQGELNKKLWTLEQTPHWDEKTAAKYKGGIAYDGYVDRQLQLSKQQHTANKYQYDYTYTYKYNS